MGVKNGINDNVNYHIIPKNAETKQKRARYTNQGGIRRLLLMAALFPPGLLLTNRKAGIIVSRES